MLKNAVLIEVFTYFLVPFPCFSAAGVSVPAAASPAVAHDAAAPSSCDAPAALVDA